MDWGLGSRALGGGGGGFGFWVQDDKSNGVLKGSWNLVTRVIIRVTLLITTYNPN